MDTRNLPAEATETPATSLTQDWLRLLRHWLRDRRVLIALAVAVVVAGAVLNWGWLVAIGVAPIILSLLPCAVMCAIGLCAMRSGSSACGDEATKEDRGRDVLPAAPELSRRDGSSDSEQDRGSH